MENDAYQRPSLKRSLKSAETLSVPAGAEGAVVQADLEYTLVRNENGNGIGAKGDTSLSFSSSSIFITEKTKDDFLNGPEINGDYWVDYGAGVVTVRKAGSGTSETCSYYYGSSSDSGGSSTPPEELADTGSTGLVSVTDTAIVVSSADTTRRSLAIYNEGPSDCRIGYANTVTYDGSTDTDGILLKVNGAAEIENTSAVYAVCSSGETTTLSFANETIA